MEPGVPDGKTIAVLTHRSGSSTPLRPCVIPELDIIYFKFRMIAVEVSLQKDCVPKPRQRLTQQPLLRPAQFTQVTLIPACLQISREISRTGYTDKDKRWFAYIIGRIQCP